MLLPAASDAQLALALVEDAFVSTGGLDELQREVFDGTAHAVYGVDPAGLEPMTDARADGAPPFVCRQAVHLMVVLELVEHPLRPEVAVAVEHYAVRLGVPTAILRDARRLAQDHFSIMYLDLQRHSWYRAETIRESLAGRFVELARSKLAYIGVVEDNAIARKWRALRDCPEGSWGRGVAEFYDRHGFPFPGERHGIYELGARHDWIHVLAGYETTPEGEIDVFSFIAASMHDETGLVLLAITLGLFQNGGIHHVSGKYIPNARNDTLSDPGATVRMTDALRRGAGATVDVMGDVDLFEYRGEPLDAVRTRFGVLAPG